MRIFKLGKLSDNQTEKWNYVKRGSPIFPHVKISASKQRPTRPTACPSFLPFIIYFLLSSPRSIWAWQKILSHVPHSKMHALCINIPILCFWHHPSHAHPAFSFPFIGRLAKDFKECCRLVAATTSEQKYRKILSGKKENCLPAYINKMAFLI